MPLADAERAELLDAVPAGDRIELERLIAVPPDAVAWLMDRAVDTVQAHMTVAAALERVRTASLPRVQSVCLVDADGRLDGYVDMQDLALAEPGERLAAHAASGRGDGWRHFPTRDGRGIGGTPPRRPPFRSSIETGG